MANFWNIAILFSVCLMMNSLVSALPKMRMRLCVQSNNPYRLQNQCVYCHNKKFQETVRTCTGALYLPGNVSLEEGFCMVRQCRAQMPLYRPEPFLVGPDLGDAVGVNVNDVMQGNDLSYSSGMGTQGLVSGYNAGMSPLLNRPLRRRPPAPIFVGRPVVSPKIRSPFRPSLFGRKETVDEITTPSK